MAQEGSERKVAMQQQGEAQGDFILKPLNGVMIEFK